MQFATFAPDVPRRAASFTLRRALPRDAPVVAALWAMLRTTPAAEVEGQVRAHLQAIADGQLPEAVFLAEVAGTPVAYGKCGVKQYPDAPDGGYLLGLDVHPAHRRCRIGLALGRRRLRWLAERTDQAYAFVSSENFASLALQAKLGFVEHTRAFTIPRVTFRGEGILFRQALTDRDG